jgi:hypothetical protein
MAITVPTRQVLKMDNWTPGGIPPMTRKIVTPIRDDDRDAPILPVPDPDPTKPANPNSIDMVFVPSDLFNSFFCVYDENGLRQLPTNGIPSLERYKYLAHTRQVNTQHMADAGVDDEQGVFSIVISHRAAPFPGVPRAVVTPQTSSGPHPGSRPSLTLPKSAIVHLVSLQGIETYVRLPVAETRVGLVSLASWTYTCLPPESVNFVDSMRAIGKTIPTPEYALRPPPSILNAVSVGETDPASATVSRIQDRLSDGYTIVRYLTHTGEETSAFFRGAFSPTLPQHPLNTYWPGQVNFSSALQILDQDLGIIDITYSTAWELGRAMAVADKSFTAALSRVRRAAQVKSADDTKKANRGILFRSKADVMTRMPDTINFIGKLAKNVSTNNAKSGVPKGNQALGGQYQQQTSQTASSPPHFETTVHKTMTKIASGTPRFENSGSVDADTPYNEINIAANADWATVLKWVVDRMFLYNVPAHYLIADPSHLPPESMRFFYIDPNWIDAMIDGALSIGNHLNEANDVVRTAMKAALNSYFSTPIDSNLHPYHPQIPCFGFFLRSAVVKAFPNLQIHAPFSDPPNPNEQRVQILRNEIVDKDVLLCLIDRLPGAADLSTITISQPPHQQRFAIGTEFGPDSQDNINTIEFSFKAVYTTKVTDPEYSDPVDRRQWKEGIGEIQPPPPETPLNPPNPKWIFDWDTNTMIVPEFAKACNNVLNQRLATNNDFVDPIPSSALVGIQLNDPAQKMVITCPLDPAGKVPLEKDNPYTISLQSYPTTTSESTGSNPIPTASRSAVSTTTKISPTNLRVTLQSSTGPKTSAPLDVPRRSIQPTTTQSEPRVSRSLRLVADSAVHTAAVATSKNGFLSAAFVAGVVGDPTMPIYPSGSAHDLPVDIVFALTRSTLQDPTLLIWKIDVVIPQGTEKEHLFDAYTGTGAKMLSNQRFNVHRQGTTAGKYYCSLIPRSTTQLVKLVDNPDCSFILNQVSLNKKPGTVFVEVYEYYKAHGPGSDPTKWPNTGTGRSTIQLTKKVLTSTTK